MSYVEGNFFGWFKKIRILLATSCIIWHHSVSTTQIQSYLKDIALVQIFLILARFQTDSPYLQRILHYSFLWEENLQDGFSFVQVSFISHFLARPWAQCKSSAGCHNQFTFCLSWSCYFTSKLCHVTVCLLFRTFRITWYCTGDRQEERGWENKKPTSRWWYVVIYYYRVVTVTTVITITYLSVVKLCEINPIPTFSSYCFQGLSLRKLSKNKGIFSQIDPCNLWTY